MDFITKALEKYLRADGSADVDVITQGPSVADLQQRTAEAMKAVDDPAMPDLPPDQMEGVRGLGTPGQTELAVASCAGLSACPEIAQRVGADPQAVLDFTKLDLLLGSRSQTLQVITERCAGSLQRIDLDSLRALDELAQELDGPAGASLKRALGGNLAEVLRTIKTLKDASTAAQQRAQASEARDANTVQKAQQEAERQQRNRAFISHLAARK